MIPVLSTRNSTLPALISLMAFATSWVTVPVFGLGISPRGPKHGLYGAKITGGGTGGTVAVFGKISALKEHIPQIATEYSRRVGEMPDIFEGTSPGAIEFGAKRYAFGASGWKRFDV